MKNKPVTPYDRLIRAVRRYVSSVLYPKKKTMWVYPKDKLSQGWSLSDLYERVAAADQLGYDVRLRIGETGLVVEYVERPKEIDYPI
jgi:hypothetical protein